MNLLPNNEQAWLAADVYSDHQAASGAMLFNEAKLHVSANDGYGVLLRGGGL
jgi:hypothetical protein